MKIKTKITLGFAAEIICFVSVGISIPSRQWVYLSAFLILAMFFASYVGKFIEQDAIEKYKEGKLK